jgi:ribosomal protein S18 acetylase RimI-like enzyme
MAITLRPVEADDAALLRAVYASTREPEMALVDWPPEQKRAFLEMQFTAQDRYYHEHLPDVAYLIVLWEGEPVGRLYVGRWPDEIRLVDIALLPEYRNRGIGSALFRDLMAEARDAGKPLRIHVERFNPAQRLYQRLGFVQIADEGVYLFLEWRPDDDYAQATQPKTAS